MSTADDILDLAQDYIQTRGYNGFSYKDIAAKLGIKTSSIHYHFAKKSDLGCAVIRRYITDFERHVRQAEEKEQQGPEAAWQALDQYLGPFIETAHTGTKICLCMALGGEIMSLPSEIRAEVGAFFSFNEEWLSQILHKGKESGAFQLNDHPEHKARIFFSTLEGALLITRAKQDEKYFKRIIHSLKQDLAP